MNKLRKRKTYDELINDLNNQPTIRYPKREGKNMLNNFIISNLIFNNENIDEKIIEQKQNIIKTDQFTQTPHTKGIQTDILNKETQKNFKPEHYDVYPHLYYKIDAMSKYMPNNKKIINKNNAFAGIISTDDKNKYDSIVQTSSYIPSSLKQKSDNINQTVRYMLKTFESPIQTPVQTPIPTPPESPTPTPSEESIPPIDEGNPPRPGLIDWLVSLTLPNPPASISSKPSVPSASPPPSSPSESPPPSEIELTEQQIRERSRSRDSIKSDKNGKFFK